MNIYYKKSVKHDLKQIDISQRQRIREILENEITKNIYAGKPLKGGLEGLYSLRIGDYRVVYQIVSDGVLIVAIRHRKDIYRFL
jgi:mRNA interferase RelE/StbE